MKKIQSKKTDIHLLTNTHAYTDEKERVYVCKI